MKTLIRNDLFLLGRKSSDATLEDVGIVDELNLLLDAHKYTCTGVAANMLGYLKRIMVIVRNNNKTRLALINPEIVQTYGGKVHLEEGCICLDEMHPTNRYSKIKVAYLDSHMKQRFVTLQGNEAYAFQHEYDHFEGIIV